MEITLKPELWIEPPVFFKQIKAAGYEAREEVRLKLTGKIMREGEHLIFVMDDIKPEPVKLVLLAPQANDQDTEEDQMRKKTAYEKAGTSVDQPIEVEGWWIAPENEESLPGLQLLDIQVKRS